MSRATRTAASASGTSPTYPGTVDTPAAMASLLELIFSPSAAMAEDGGPTNVTPAAVRASTKYAFSDRNPYPGCTAVAPEEITAAITLGTER